MIITSTRLLLAFSLVVVSTCTQHTGNENRNPDDHHHHKKHNRQNDHLKKHPGSSRPHVIPNTHAVFFHSSVSCADVVGATLRATGCEVVFRIDYQSKLASMCSFEIGKGCDNHQSTISAINGFMVLHPVQVIARPYPVLSVPLTNETDLSKQTFPSSSPAATTTATTTTTTTGQALIGDYIHKPTGVLDARIRLGLTGKGIKVAIVDTGVYYLHPALGGGFGKGFKVAFGHDLVGDRYNGQSTTIREDWDPLDNCSAVSHGTHVAGIVAADASNLRTNYNFTPAYPFLGVAPDVTLGAYRIFGCSGPTANDISAKAILMAANDGADIINLSLGGFANPDDVTNAAAEIVSKSGHIVVAANGNDGAAGAYVANSPAISSGAIGVAAFRKSKVLGFVLSVDYQYFRYSPGVSKGNFNFNIPISKTIVVNNPNAIAKNVLDDGCQGMSVDVRGKAVLLYFAEQQVCGSRQRCNNAYNQGAAMCLLYYSKDTFDIGIYGGDKIPSLVTTLSAGKAIIAGLVTKRNPVVIPTDQYSVFPSATGETLSSFSSPGLTTNLYIKPDIGGIGGNVYSTISSYAAKANSLSSAYTTLSGTSMASPYVAGCLALLLQKRGRIGFNMAKALLMNTATPTTLYSTSLIHSPIYQGAGLVNIYKAAITGTVVTPSSLSLNDTVYFRKNPTIRIQNNHQGSATYTISHVPAATTNPCNHGDDVFLDQSTTFFTGSNIATVKIGSRGVGNYNRSAYSVTIASGSSIVIPLVFTPPSTAFADLWPIYGGYIVIQSSFDRIATHIPYAGVAGIWSNRRVWARNSTSLYNRWALGPQGPLGLFGVVPRSTGTGLYANKRFTPLTNHEVLNVNSYGYVLAPTASDTRNANITITYLCLDDWPLRTRRLQRTNVLALTPVGGNGYLQIYQSILQRNSYSDGSGIGAPVVYRFDGHVFGTGVTGPILLPPGVYQITFAAWKNFGNGNQLDLIKSPPFQLVYGNTPLDPNFLNRCS